MPWDVYTVYRYVMSAGSSICSSLFIYLLYLYLLVVAYPDFRDPKPTNAWWHWMIQGHLGGGKSDGGPSIQFLVHIDANLGDCTTLVLYGAVCYYTTLLAFSTKANRSNEVCHITCFLGTASHRRSNYRPAYIIHVTYLNNIIWNLLFIKRIVQLCMISMSALVTVLCSTAISSRFCLHRETSIPTVSTKRLMKPLLLEVPCKLTSVTPGIRRGLDGRLCGPRCCPRCCQDTAWARSVASSNSKRDLKMSEVIGKCTFKNEDSTFKARHLTIKNWDLITKMKIQSSKRCFNQPKSFHIIPLDFTYLKYLKMRIWLDESCDTAYRQLP